jgi:hypothetical protein
VGRVCGQAIGYTATGGTGANNDEIKDFFRHVVFKRQVFLAQG